MVRAILVGDIHIRDTSPSSRVEGYREDMIAKLEYVAELEKKLKADIVIWKGDVFDFPRPDRTSHATVLKMLAVIKKFNNVWTIFGNHDLCVSDDTQALTDKGWRTLYELDGTEKFATLNPETNNIEFHVPETIRQIKYTGEAYRFKSARIDLLTSPNHAFYVRTRTKNPLQKIKAKDLYNKKYETVLPISSGVSTGTYPEVIDLGYSEIESNLAMKFLGWYVAEGTSDPPYRFTISQSLEVNPEHYKEIEGILDLMSVKYESNAKTLRVYNSELTEWLIKNVGRAGSKDMRIPEFMYSLHPGLIRAFLWAYFRGDGSIQGTKEYRAKADYSRASVSARCRNSLLADDLCALAEIIGYRTNKSELKEFPYAGTEYVGHAHNIGFNQGTSSGLLPIPTKEFYSGVMWCPDVTNHIWLARRNGKTVWTGNSNDRIKAIYDKQPLGVLIAGGLKVLDGWHPEFPIYGLHWQQDWIVDPNAPSRAFEDWRNSDRDLSNSLAVTHAPIYPPSEQKSVIFELLPTSGEGSVAEAMGGTGYLSYGHIHEDHGVFTDGGVTYENVGALSRGSLAEYNLEREIKVAVWDSSKGFREVPVPSRPASEIFFKEKHDEVVKEKKSLDSFLKDVSGTKIEISNVESVKDHIQKLDIDKTIKKKAVEILSEVS